jgi:hypothetical protein
MGFMPKKKAKSKRKSKRPLKEDFNQAAFRVVQESTKERT